MITTCGIFLYNEDTKQILIVHPTNAPGNQWSIPKGEMEDEKEYPWDRALLELKEETNLDFSYLQHSLNCLGEEVYKTGKKKLIGFMLRIKTNYFWNQYITCNSLVNNDFPEVDGFAWVSLNLASKLIHETQKKMIPNLIEKLKEEKVEV